MIDLIDQPIDVASVLRAVESAAAGAVAAFVGTVREQSGGRPVVRLHYEAYEPMARRQLARVVEQARTHWPTLTGVAVVHRHGTLGIGEVAVVVAVAAPHRGEAFAACQFVIDTLKQVVPIWKREQYTDGTEWVAAHP